MVSKSWKTRLTARNPGTYVFDFGREYAPRSAMLDYKRMNDNYAGTNHYKDTADRLRAFAGQDDNPETRASLLAVADSYDRRSGPHVASAGVNRNWRR